MDAKPAPVAQAASSAKIHISPGVRTILHGAKESPRPKAVVPVQMPRRVTDYWPIIRTLMVATDLLLLFLCGLLVWRAAGVMTVWEALGCTLAVALGAALTCASILIGPKSLSLVREEVSS